MSDLKCARLMLRSAERDLRAMQILAAEGPEEGFGFHVQPSSEAAPSAVFTILFSDNF